MFARAFITRLGLVALFLCLSGAVVAARAFEIVPHRAVYDLSFAGARGSSQVIDVTGSMVFEWEDACDGWSVTQRTAMSFSYQSGETVNLGWNLVTWESKDGMRYRFFIRNLQNGELKEEYRGEAHLDGPGQGGVADYTVPEGRKIQLPPGTLFPTAHTVTLLKHIEAGESFLWATIFDGFDADGVSDISALVTKNLGTDTGAGRSPLLSSVPSDRVHLAFFKHTDGTTEPEHEQQLRLHMNGIVESIVLDFGDFNVQGKLTELKALKPPC
jgi:envelope integrity protein B